MLTLDPAVLGLLANHNNTSAGLICNGSLMSREKFLKDCLNGLDPRYHHLRGHCLPMGGQTPRSVYTLSISIIARRLMG